MLSESYIFCYLQSLLHKNPVIDVSYAADRLNTHEKAQNEACACSHEQYDLLTDANTHASFDERSRRVIKLSVAAVSDWLLVQTVGRQTPDLRLAQFGHHNRSHTFTLLIGLARVLT